MTKDKDVFLLVLILTIFGLAIARLSADEVSESLPFTCRVDRAMWFQKLVLLSHIGFPQEKKGPTIFRFLD